MSYPRYLKHRFYTEQPKKIIPIFFVPPPPKQTGQWRVYSVMFFLIPKLRLHSVSCLKPKLT